ncbi:MAG: hypothetical protein H6626_01185 [Pseudobdellovibrionaceae bacterium]|nr:hypothetical protein [Bdellovibrionales bacterium]USN47737.1 MAG: hypothetical protein H6626_01185 [Pseudobdellovibrionaceae bacterium]
MKKFGYQMLAGGMVGLVASVVLALPSDQYRDYDLDAALRVKYAAESDVSRLQQRERDLESQLSRSQTQLSSNEYQISRNRNRIQDLGSERQDKRQLIERLERRQDQLSRRRAQLAHEERDLERRIRQIESSVAVISVETSRPIQMAAAASPQKNTDEGKRNRDKGDRGGKGDDPARNGDKNPERGGRDNTNSPGRGGENGPGRGNGAGPDKGGEPPAGGGGATPPPKNNPELDRLKAELRKVRGELAQVSHQLNEVQRDISQASHRLERIRYEVSDLQDQNQRLLRENQQLERDIVAYRQDLQVVGVELDGALSELASANREVARIERNLDLAKAEVSPVAKSHGSTDGAASGKEYGTIAGDLRAAETAGYENGTAAANDKQAYDEGYKQGVDTAWDEIKAASRVAKQKGYNDRVKFYRTSKLEEIVIDASEVLSYSNESLQSSSASTETDKYYRPRPGSYPHPRIKEFYMSAYHSAFNAERSRSYSEHEQKEYSDKYPMYKSGSVTSPEYKTAYANANRAASLKKGKQEGYNITISTNKDKEVTKAYGEGVSEVDQLYRNNPILDDFQFKLVDGDGDGFVLPGESAQLELNLKNFGLVEKRGLSASIKGEGSSITPGTKTFKLPELPAQSQVKVINLGNYDVPSNMSVGQTFFVNAGLKEGQKTLFEKNLEGQIAYPMQMELASKPVDLPTSEAGSFVFSVYNKSQVTQSAVIHIKYDSSKVSNAWPTSFTVGPRQTRQVTVRVKGNSRQEFSWTTLSFVVKKNGLTASSTESVKIQVNDGKCLVGPVCDY